MTGLCRTGRKFLPMGLDWICSDRTNYDRSTGIRKNKNLLKRRNPDCAKVFFASFRKISLCKLRSYYFNTTYDRSKLQFYLICIFNLFNNSSQKYSYNYINIKTNVWTNYKKWPKDLKSSRGITRTPWPWPLFLACAAW